MNHTVAFVIGAVVLANIAAALWLIWWTARVKDSAGAQTTTHVWDDDLTEYNNPLPRWWLWLFILSILFGLGYLALYPGLGLFDGLRHWSSVSQYEVEKASAGRVLEQRLSGIKTESLRELSHDPGAMATARNLFALNCSTCHGSDARGAKGFPNLTDADWLWGGDPSTVYQTIAKGRDNAMPAWGGALGPSGVENVVSYVLTLSGRLPQSARTAGMNAQVEAGATTFKMLCAACHGADGRGTPALGAPNLTDSVWLHGGEIEDIRETITHGRINHMPAHLDLLGETKVRLLAAYVLSLSEAANPTRARE